MIYVMKLHNFDIHYCLHGVNERLNRIIRDPVFTKRLSFVKRSSDNFIDRLSDNTILDRFCSKILPEIHHQVEQLYVESASMKTVLHATDYPELRCLGLCNVDEESIQNLLTSSDIFAISDYR